MADVTYDFSDRVVAITGAGTGIGKAAAEGFARAGAAVYLLDIDADAGEAAAQGTGTFISCDITSAEQVDAAFGVIEADHGRLDVLVNNAGGFWAQRSTDELDLDEWYRVIDLNLNAVFLTARRAIPLLRGSAAGRIINLGSMAAQVSNYRTSPPYVAAKAGTQALTRILAWELAGDEITVNAIAPSVVLTERILHLRDEEERAATARTVPLGRYQSTDELAAWILYLATEEAGFMTGQTVSVNGGRHMAH